MVNLVTLNTKDFLINEDDLFNLTSLDEIRTVLKPGLILETDDMIVYHIYRTGEEIIPADEDFEEEINEINNPIFIVYNKHDIQDVKGFSYGMTRSGKPATDLNYEDYKINVHNKVVVIIFNGETLSFIYNKNDNEILFIDRYLNYDLLGYDKINNMLKDVNNYNDLENTLDIISDLQWTLENNKDNN